jgi:hypothetical protein
MLGPCGARQLTGAVMVMVMVMVMVIAKIWPLTFLAAN